ncbi:MAG: class I poly(R)-hydroxyalkanoic acid synthase [Betaproteobacteria bacterium]|nr:class I poly(R)-hydroxyalkanoic acid synthase [Betaproteobacteria bacterium]
MSAPDPYSMEPWTELASQWQHAIGAWAQWWMRGFGGPAPAPRKRRGTIAPAPFDLDAVAKLQATYAPRFASLWASAADALARPGAVLPEIVAGDAGDRRFGSAAWREQPYFAWIRQAYVLYAEYLTEIARLAQLPPAEKRRLEFSTRQFIDAIAPTNFPGTNPDVIVRALSTEGASLVQGLRNLAGDVARGRITMSDESAFEVGRNLAVTPGSVVFRNDLIELIQYAATTTRVADRPLLIVPPCINKYYILDLKPANSFVRHVVAQGHTVFMISWRNIPQELGRLTWDDYLEHGVLAALSAAKAITGSKRVNTLGFCVGGTLLACALAVLAARRDDSAATMTLLTTMLDFADPGEIGVYITREGIAAREPALLAGQRVHGAELAGAFASLRPNDLVWNYVVSNYLEGRTPPAFDLLHWNGDSSNLPGPMYAYYLKNMYVENRLREPRALTMLGEPIDLGRIDAPAYVYASRDDHIVPWRSAYRTLDLIGGKSVFVLGASGHIAGVVNPPEPVRRNYWTNPSPARTADDWLAAATARPGSWWPHWYHWLARHKGGERAAPAKTGNAEFPPLAAAPGAYVRESAP